MRVILSNRSESPIYEQIKSQIRDQIMRGEIAEGSALPSIRSLAKDLGISVITTARAYTDLEAEGFISTVQGKGTYVQAKDGAFVREQYLKQIEEALLRAIELSQSIELQPEELKALLNTMLEVSV